MKLAEKGNKMSKCDHGIELGYTCLACECENGQKKVDRKKVYVGCETCIHFDLEKKLSCFCLQCKHYQKHNDFYKRRVDL